MIQPLFLLLALQAAPDVSTPGTAELAGARWRELKDAVDDEREVQVAQLAWASARTVALEYVEGGGPGAPAGLKIRARWTVRSLVEAPFLGSLIGPGAEIQSVRWDGRPATIATSLPT